MMGTMVMSPNPVISSSHCDYGNYFKTSSTTHKSNSLQDRKSLVNSNQRRNSAHTPLTKTTSLTTHCSGQQQLATNTTTSMRLSGSSSSSGEPRKLDRALSEPADRRAAQSNSSRYKTELCRPFEENGTCKYGDKCQFAHGIKELRTLVRHPKYKTELCRTFHSTGLCPYGPRCHFIHNSEQSKNTLLSSLVSNAVPTAVNRPKALSSSSLGSAGDLSPSSSQSGSPTLLKSFDDLFHAATPLSPSVNSNTAFSFSQDFVSLMAPVKQQPPNNTLLLQAFGMLQQQQQQPPPTTPDPFELALPNSEFYDVGVYQEGMAPMFGCASPSSMDSRSELDSLSLRVNPVSFAQPLATSPAGLSSSPLDIGSSYGRLTFFNQLGSSQD